MSLRSSKWTVNPSSTLLQSVHSPPPLLDNTDPLHDSNKLNTLLHYQYLFNSLDILLDTRRGASSVEIAPRRTSGKRTATVIRGVTARSFTAKSAISVSAVLARTRFDAISARV
ncbi:hypothetical protein EXIGLDRAFT_732941 [Exidia glandulosa HHB12029]|uniref:Uncharacterized protein n=1 Tax=Exidia glandulosa HHB12029 TaxID=1314781 RepID=A0A165PUU0_EXIGL|nr:hypothetical protein EXIGLDRAFT_732941 [Exidia glandulosa HHB12029]